MTTEAKPAPQATISPEGAQPLGASSPTGAAPGAGTQDEWLQRLSKLEQAFNTHKSVTGKQLAERDRQIAAYKEAARFPEDTIARLADRENWLSELAERYEADPDLLSLCADYASAKAVAEKYQEGVGKGRQGLEAELKELKERRLPEARVSGGLPNPSGGVGGGGMTWEQAQKSKVPLSDAEYASLIK